MSIINFRVGMKITRPKDNRNARRMRKRLQKRGAKAAFARELKLGQHFVSKWMRGVRPNSFYTMVLEKHGYPTRDWFVEVAP